MHTDLQEVPSINMLSKFTVIQSILPDVRLIFSDGETVMIDFSSSKGIFLEHSSNMDETFPGPISY